jgi:hypothetical protein
MDGQVYRKDGSAIVGAVIDMNDKSNKSDKSDKGRGKKSLCHLLCCTSGASNPGHLPGIDLNRGSYWPLLFRNGKPYANDDVGWSKVYHSDARRH